MLSGAPLSVALSFQGYQWGKWAAPRQSSLKAVAISTFSRAQMLPWQEELTAQKQVDTKSIRETSHANTSKWFPGGSRDWREEVFLALVGSYPLFCASWWRTAKLQSVLWKGRGVSALHCWIPVTCQYKWGLFLISGLKPVSTASVRVSTVQLNKLCVELNKNQGIFSMWPPKLPKAFERL